MNKYIAIPFSGFYDSIHAQAFDDELERAFSDSSGCEVRHGLVNVAYDAMNWRDAFDDYAKEYAGQFAHAAGVKLKFESLDSPLEYNFSTDRIFCEISLEEVKRLYKTVDRDKLAALVKRDYTSRDGFVSFYSNVLDDWGDVETWDHNQLSTLLEACNDDADFENDRGGAYDTEMDVYEHLSSNGVISDLIFKHCPVANRLSVINEYLNRREDRKLC